MKTQRIISMNYHGHEPGDIVVLWSGGHPQIKRVVSVGIEACVVRDLYWHERAWRTLCRFGRWLRRVILGA